MWARTCVTPCVSATGLHVTAYKDSPAKYQERHVAQFIYTQHLGKRGCTESAPQVPAWAGGTTGPEFLRESHSLLPPGARATDTKASGCGVQSSSCCSVLSGRSGTCGCFANIQVSKLVDAPETASGKTGLQVTRGCAPLLPVASRTRDFLTNGLYEPRALMLAGWGASGWVPARASLA